LDISYKQNIKLAGIIYLHRISDNRMAGASLKNLRMFTSICGLDAMPSVIIVTSMWDEVRAEAGERREKELKETFWKEMVAHGCKTERFDHTFETAWDIIGNLSPPRQAPLQLPKDIVDTHLLLNETQAGLTLRDELQRLLKDQKDATQRIKEQVAKQSDKLVIQQLDDRRLEIESKIQQIAVQLHAMKIPFTRKLRLYLRGQCVDPLQSLCLADSPSAYLDEPDQVVSESEK
jgi:chromosome condensin MukBEF ATPase and DNA-binding subunit MukB